MDRATGALIVGGLVEMSGGHSPESRGLFRGFHFGYRGGRDPSERFAYGSDAPSRRRGRCLLGSTERLCLLRRIPCRRAGWCYALHWSYNQPTECCPLRFGMQWVRMQQHHPSRFVQHFDL